MEILVDTPGRAGTRTNLERVDELTRALRADQAVAGVQSLTSVLPDAALDAYTRLYANGLAGVDPKLTPGRRRAGQLGPGRRPGPRSR